MGKFWGSEIFGWEIWRFIMKAANQVDVQDVTGITPETQLLVLGIMSSYEDEEMAEKLDQLPDQARAEIMWWFGRMDAYLRGDL